MFDDFLEMVDSRLPEFCSRRKAEEAMDGLLKARTLANLDSKGIGPGGILVGKKIMYKKSDLLNWLKGYLLKTEPSKAIQSDYKYN